MGDTTQSAIACRVSRPEDVDFIYRCLTESATEIGLDPKMAQTPASLQEALFSDKPIVECLIGEINGQPIGIMLFSMIHTNFPYNPKPGIYIYELHVIEEYRLHGIARKLGVFLINLAKERNCSSIEGMIPKDEKILEIFLKTFPGAETVEGMDYLRLKLP